MYVCVRVHARARARALVHMENGNVPGFRGRRNHDISSLDSSHHPAQRNDKNSERTSTFNVHFNRRNDGEERSNGVVGTYVRRGKGGCRRAQPSARRLAREADRGAGYEVQPGRDRSLRSDRGKRHAGRDCRYRVDGR